MFGVGVGVGVGVGLGTICFVFVPVNFFSLFSTHFLLVVPVRLVARVRRYGVMWCTLDTAKGVRRVDFTEGGFCLLFGRIGGHVSNL